MKFIKQITAVILCAAAIMMCLSGCGGSKEIDMNGLAQELMAADIFDEELTSVSDSVTIKRLAIKDGAVDGGVSYIGTNAVVDEIIILKAVNDQGKEKIENGMKTHIENQKKSYTSYAPSQVSKLDDYVMVTSGNYEILVVSNDNETAKRIVKEYIK